MVEIYRIIANANIGFIDRESANPLRMLMMSPFLITDIEGKMTKNNQQQQYYLINFIQQHKAESLIQWA
jgi:hypothetical protein